MSKKIIFVFMAIITTLGVGAESLCGGDRDSHGCIGSAGYQWSEVRQDCIRLWEAGVELDSIKIEDAWYGVYGVFDTDSSKVELFYPNKEKSIILEKNQNNWNGKDYILEKMGDSYKLIKK